jgi:hypothetical protein
MSNFSTFSPLFIVPLADEPEEERELGAFMRLLASSGLGRLLRPKAPRGPDGGQPPYDASSLLAAILFAFSDTGGTVRDVADSCRFDLRYRYLTSDAKPGKSTVAGFISRVIAPNADAIFRGGHRLHHVRHGRQPGRRGLRRRVEVRGERQQVQVHLPLQEEGPRSPREGGMPDPGERDALPREAGASLFEADRGGRVRGRQEAVGRREGSRGVAEGAGAQGGSGGTPLPHAVRPPRQDARLRGDGQDMRARPELLLQDRPRRHGHVPEGGLLLGRREQHARRLQRPDCRQLRHYRRILRLAGQVGLEDAPGVPRADEGDVGLLSRGGLRGRGVRLRGELLLPRGGRDIVLRQVPVVGRRGDRDKARPALALRRRIGPLPEGLRGREDPAGEASQVQGGGLLQDRQVPGMRVQEVLHQGPRPPEGRREDVRGVPRIPRPQADGGGKPAVAQGDRAPREQEHPGGGDLRDRQAGHGVRPLPAEGAGRGLRGDDADMPRGQHKEVLQLPQEREGPGVLEGACRA